MAAVEITAKVTGQDGLRDLFEAKRSATKKGVRAALMGLARAGAQAARAAAPVKSGTLRRSIEAIGFGSRGEVVGALVRTNEPHAPYGYFLEMGVVNHRTIAQSVFGLNSVNRRGSGGKRKQARAREALMAAGNWRIAPRPWFGAARAAIAPRMQAVVAEALRAAMEEAK